MFPLHDANPRHGPAFVMWFLLFLNVAVFVYGLSLGSDRAALRFVYDYGFVPSLFFEAPVANLYRLLTSMFLHGGVVHILGNMFFLWVFGDNIEDRLGHVGFLIFYLVGGVLATLVHGLFSLASAVPMIGASGAVSAVLGAYLVLFPRQRIFTFVPPFFLFWLPAWFYLGYWALIQFVQAGGLVVRPGAVNDVAFWAHVGGFLFGALTVRRFAKPAPPPGYRL